MTSLQQGANGAETKTAGDIPSAEPVAILYENWRGETAVRHIIVGGEDADRSALWFGLNEWHRVPQHLISAWDVEKGAYRDFAMSGIKAWGQAAVDAALSASPRADGAGATAREEPRIFKDGDAWCCLLGDDLQDGIAGFGNTPDAARRNFRERLSGNLCSALRGALQVADDTLREIARDVRGTDWLLDQEAEGRGPLAVIKAARILSPARREDRPGRRTATTW